MSDFRAYLRRARELPPRAVVHRAAALAGRALRGQVERIADRCRSTYALLPDSGELRRHIRLGASVGHRSSREFRKATDNYLHHRFDLLGSGWTQVRHGIECLGLEGYRFPAAASVGADADGAWLRGRINAANLSESQRLWRLIQQPYTPIDWHLDFKSGYRWAEDAHFHTIRYGQRIGADVKVPWELSRLQHLPQLARAFGEAKARPWSGADPDVFRREIRNQILDFVATNPPRYGINWTCAMEVAIRIVNIVLAVDLLRDSGFAVDAEFGQILTRTVREHAVHILDNLEWSQEGCGNHYLADVVGLLFASSYLPADDETTSWSAFAIKQLMREAELQFNSDGGNIESSSNYHCLSTEMLTFATALVFGFEVEEVRALAQATARLPVRPPQYGAVPVLTIGSLVTLLPRAFLETVFRAGNLAQDLQRPDGRFLQWGDTDSGKLLKLAPVWREAPSPDGDPIEEVLNPAPLVSSVDALRADRVAAAAPDWSAALVAALAGGNRVDCAIAKSNVVTGTDLDLETLVTECRSAPAACVRELAFELPEGWQEGLQRTGYEAFGHYAFRSERLFFAVRCPSRLPPLRGHAHDDALSVELMIDGRDLLVDPGTYVYTPLPAQRNAYRHHKAHNGPRPTHYDGLDFSTGLFDAKGFIPARCLYFGPSGFAGELTTPAWSVRRFVLFAPERLLILDHSSPRPLAPFPPKQDTPHVCEGYGRYTTRPIRNF